MNQSDDTSENDYYALILSDVPKHIKENIIDKW